MESFALFQNGHLLSTWIPNIKLCYCHGYYQYHLIKYFSYNNLILNKIYLLYWILMMQRMHVRNDVLCIYYYQYIDI
jgi:hypothetical protein